MPGRLLFGPAWSRSDSSKLWNLAAFELAVVCIGARAGVRGFFVDDGKKELRCLAIRIYFRRFRWRLEM